MLNELKLGLFFWFVSADPVAVMQMLAPERPIVRTDEIVVFDNSELIV
jgi:hypothetical protein